MQANAKDMAAGALFVAIGLYFAVDSYMNLRIGEAFAMGPGYFPLLLGSILALFGVVMSAGAIGKPTESFGAVPWRGVALVTVSLIFFALTLRGLGMALALFGSVVMAARSSGLLGWRASAMLSLIATLFSIVVFIYLLGLPYPVVGEWLEV